MNRAVSRAATDATSVTVALGDRQYDILIGSGLLTKTGDLVAYYTAAAKAVILTDDNVSALYGETVTQSLNDAGITSTLIAIPPGEASKSFHQFESVCERIIDMRIDRQTIIIALGGGVVGDLAGFVASVLLRGIRFVQIPTTLLAQVDSSVGGKTAINSKHGKNLIGHFHQPSLVITDVDTLDTLPERERRAGYAEVVKYGLIGDAAFFDWCEANGLAMLEGNRDTRIDAIERCCRHKARIVAADEQEKGQRALLNLGHTFGHALEKSVQYDARLLHGEAVAIGMVLAFRMSVKLGLASDKTATRVEHHLAVTGLPTSYRTIPGIDSPGRLVEYMYSDKKAIGNTLTFVLAHDIGEAFIARDVDPEQVRSLMEEAP